MAYMNQEKKSKIAANLKPILKQYGIKGSLSVRNNLAIVLKITQGKIDFIENYIKTDSDKSNTNKLSQDQVDYIRKNRSIDVNPYWYQEHFSGKAKEFLQKVFAAMKSANWYDESDAQTDYFNTAYYVDVNIGSWQKPYELVYNHLTIEREFRLEEKRKQAINA
jgi:hypothetical protein